MLMAKNQLGELVYSEKIPLEKRQDCFYCPECQQVVKLRIATGKRPYFYHVKKLIGTGESLQHQKRKQQVQIALEKGGQKVLPEVSLANGKRRGDLYLPEEKVVVEIQYSPLEKALLKKRTSDYKEAGLKVWWLLGENHITGKKLAPYLRYHPYLGYYYYRFTGEHLALYYHCYYEKNRFKQRKILLPERLSLKKLPQCLQQLPAVNISFNTKLDMAKNYYQKQLTLKQPLLLKEQEQFYQVGKNILELSDLYYQLGSITLPIFKKLPLFFHYQLFQEITKSHYSLKELQQLWLSFFQKEIENFPLMSPQEGLASYFCYYKAFFQQQKLWQITGENIQFSKNFFQLKA